MDRLAKILDQGARPPHVIAPVTAAATVITTMGAPAEALARIAALGVNVVRV